MTATIINAAPQGILRGIKDVSGRSPVYDSEAVPTHLPHIYLLTERGPTLPQLVVGDSMTKMYGTESFNLRGKFTNHATVLANTINAEGNQLMVQRIRPSDAPAPATLRLCVDVMQENIDQYERDVSGKFLTDSNGAKIPTGEVAPGLVLRWFVEKVGDEGIAGDTATVSTDTSTIRETEGGDTRVTETTDIRILENALGSAGTEIGSMVNTNGDQSTIYPIMEFEVTDFGAYGNNIGVRLSAPTTDSSNPVNDAVISDQRAYLYRLQLVERDVKTSIPKILETLQGEQFLDFAFKSGVIDTATDLELSLEDTFMDAWWQEASGGYPQIRGDVGRYYVYQDYLEKVLSDIQGVEAPYGLISDDEDDLHMANFLTARTYENVPYYAVTVRGPADDGIYFTETATHYMMGGGDGDLSLEAFDSAVGYQLENWGDLEAELLDMSYYPQSVIYDSGFSLDTKKKMFVPMGRRKDIWITTATQDASLPQNTASEESSMAVALRTAARLYPESEIYGTSTCRALVIGHSGELLSSQYKGLLPLTIEFAQLCAQYMGASNGIWKEGLGFNRPPNNRVTMFKNVNASFKKASVRNRDWETGLVWVQNYDRRSLFWPAFQTVYDDDSSVLNSAANMMIAVELEKVAHRTWQDLTGIDYLTDDQFIERSNRLIRDRSAKRFDNRAIIVPETYFTSQDGQRGYSWSCNIHMYAPNMKSVGSYTIVAHRREDYQGDS